MAYAKIYYDWIDLVNSFTDYHTFDSLGIAPLGMSVRSYNDKKAQYGKSLQSRIDIVKSRGYNPRNLKELENAEFESDPVLIAKRKEKLEKKELEEKKRVEDLKKQLEKKEKLEKEKLQKAIQIQQSEEKKQMELDLKIQQELIKKEKYVGLGVFAIIGVIGYLVFKK